MRKHVQNTTMTRVTLSVDALEIVPKENVLRSVLIIPAASPMVNAAIDEAADAIADDRAYQWSPLGTFPIRFTLLPGQFMWGVVDGHGIATITVICEYITEGPETA